MPPDVPPLLGLRVVELDAIGPVPFAGQLLAQLGADVERIVPPVDRGMGIGVAPEFDLLNRGKRVTKRDLKSGEGLAAARTTIGTADVLLEGFRPGTLERLGLAPAALLAANPRLVIGRLSGWGTHGPLADRAGHDINYLALAGVLHAIGPSDHPVPPLNLVADFGGGAMHLAVGVLARLVRRSIDGRGGVVETSILAGTHGLTAMFHGFIAGGIWRLLRETNLLDGGVPFYRCYATRDGRHIAVGALEGKFYRELLDVLGLAEEIDPGRQYEAASWPATTARFAAVVAERTRDEWVARASGRDACLSPVLDFTEAAANAHNRANGWFAAGDPAPREFVTFAQP